MLVTNIMTSDNIMARYRPLVSSFIISPLNKSDGDLRWLISLFLQNLIYICRKRKGLCQVMLIFVAVFAVWARRNRVIARASPRVATKDSSDAETQAFYQSMGLNRFYHILRAGRAIAADAGKQRGNKMLIKFNQRMSRVFNGLVMRCRRIVVDDAFDFS